MRPCLTCGMLISATRCRACHRVRESKLYGGAHQTKRKAWALIVAAGGVTCPRCSVALTPDAWDLDHRTGRPLCPPCNRSARGERG